MFLLGAFVANYFDRIVPVLKKYYLVLLGLSIFFVVFPQFDVRVRYAFGRSVCLTLGLIGFAYKFPKWNVPIDISYGIYLYHMIFVNIMIEIGIKGTVSSMLVVFAVTILCAYISNSFIGSKNKLVWRKNRRIQ